MPLYEYVCPACGTRFERLTSWALADEQRCPGCGEPAGRVVSTFASATTCQPGGG